MYSFEYIDFSLGVDGNPSYIHIQNGYLVPDKIGYKFNFKMANTTS